jgi:CelD/BcsL family acetyltransferase involved in cellulose biosynthesis
MSLAEIAQPVAASVAGFRARLTAFRPEDWMPRPGEATLFQTRDWLTPFYAAVAAHHPDAAPLVAEVTDEDGALAYRLPLLLCRGRLRRISFADLNMTDFNAPLLGPAAPCSADAAARALRALKAALPPHDLLSFTKMPPQIGGRPNPLLLARPGHLSAVNGNLLLMGDAWDDFHFGLEKTVRKELERSWRVFSRAPHTQYRHITDADEALAMLETINQVQKARIGSLGEVYGMDAPVTADFHRRLLRDGVPTGFTCLTVLTSGGELVAALLGVRDAETYLMIRLVHAPGDWAKVSPGRLLIHRTLHQLHGEGYRRFDFSIGNYPYKRRFGPTRTSLYDLVSAATPLGTLALLRAEAGALLRSHPRTHETVRRLLGKPPSREEN